MAYSATVCNLMIASPGDIQHERNIVREVAHEWNAINSSLRRAVLLPRGWDTHSTPLLGERPQSIINWQVGKDSDLLVAVFWTRLGTPTGLAPSGTVEEIEEHIKADKPALIYFCTAPVAQATFDAEQYDALMAFKDSCKQRGLLETYDNASEFREKVRRQISIVMNTHRYFVSKLQLGAGADDIPLVASPTSAPSLSKEAAELLLAAVAGDGTVLVAAWLGGSTVQVNETNFVEQGNPRSRAVWESAVQELVDRVFLQPVGDKGEVFQVTRQGYEAADWLKG